MKGAALVATLVQHVLAHTLAGVKVHRFGGGAALRDSCNACRADVRILALLRRQGRGGVGFCGM